jgi:hypothetical protein
MKNKGVAKGEGVDHRKRLVVVFDEFFLNAPALFLAELAFIVQRP